MTRSIWKISVFAVLLMVLLIVGGMPLLAQQSAGFITGTVVDAQRGVIPGAKVSLINQVQGAVLRDVTTSADGSFVFTPIQPGTYTVEVEAAGFKKYEKKDIKLFTNDRMALPVIVLEVGGTNEVVTVEASTVSLQTVSAERAGTVGSIQMANIATSGRQFLDLLKTVPGVNYDTQNVNGTRSDQNAIAVDGVSVFDTGCNCGGTWRINTDLVEEVKVISNGQQAEFGRAAGANISVITKGGGQQFHGLGYYFARNEWMNANSFMNNKNGLARARNRNGTYGFNIGGPIYIPGKLNQNKDKLFFFIDMEFQRPRVFDTLTFLRVPTEAERNGDFSQTMQSATQKAVIKDPLTGLQFTDNKIPTDRLNPYGLQFAKIFPMPNVTGYWDRNYSYQFATQDKSDDKNYRLDYNISKRLHLYARLITNIRPRTQNGGLNVNNAIGISPFSLIWGARSISGNLVWVVTPTMTNEFNYGNSRNWLPVTVPSDSKYLRANNGITLPMLYPNADTLGLMPNLNFGFQSYGPEIYFSGQPYVNKNPTMNYTDNFTMVFPKHMVKLGIFIENTFKWQTATVVNNGTLGFNVDSANPNNTGYPFANMLMGNYSTFRQASSLPIGNYRYHTFEWYAQDNWKVRSNLTLDYGLRFSMISPMFDENDLMSGINLSMFNSSKAVSLYKPTLVDGKKMALDPLTGKTYSSTLIGAIVPNSGDVYNGIAVAGKNGYPRGLYESRGVQLGPRFGMAWTPINNTVIRVGGGVFYERPLGNLGFGQIAFPPTVITPVLYYGNVSNLAASGSNLFPFGIGGIQKDGKNPTVVNYNFSVQRELPFRLLLDVGYVGNQSRHLLSRYPFNEPAFGAAWLPQNQDPSKPTNLNGDNALPVDLYRPYLGYAGMSATVAQSGLGGGGYIATFSDSANYNGLQISLRRRMTNLEFGINYTWGRALGTSGAFDFVQNPYNHRMADYGLLPFDRHQVMTFNYVYNFPKAANKVGFLNNFVGKLLLNDWQLTGITAFQTGTPASITYTQQMAAGGTYYSGAALNRRITGSEYFAPRPLISGDLGGSGDLLAWFNASAVKPAPVGSKGMDSAIRQLVGPGINNWDISFFKKIPYSADGTRYIQLRLEMYNAFNHTQLSAVNTTAQFDVQGNIVNLASPTNINNFGGPTTGGFRAPRSMQMGVKVYF